MSEPELRSGLGVNNDFIVIIDVIIVQTCCQLPSYLRYLINMLIYFSRILGYFHKFLTLSTRFVGAFPNRAYAPRLSDCVCVCG